MISSNKTWVRVDENTEQVGSHGSSYNIGVSNYASWVWAQVTLLSGDELV